MKTAKIKFSSIKSSDGWAELTYALKFEQFKKEHPEIEDEDELADKFYTKVVAKKFEYGEFGNFEIIVDENFNIVGGQIF
jgi:hypothetical protein